MHFGKVALAPPRLDRRVDGGGGSSCVLNLWALNERSVPFIAIWDWRSWPK
jgi:hypothetical protein